MSENEKENSIEVQKTEHDISNSNIMPTSHNESSKPKIENMGEEFMKWAEKYWAIEKIITKGCEDSVGESCPYSYLRSVFISKINELASN